MLDDRRITDGHGREASLASIKGAQETLDVEQLDASLARALMADIAWPYYDRIRHDVDPNGPLVTASHVLLEGNWLLMDEPIWRGLRRRADLIIFLTAPEELLHRRLVARKTQGGSTPGDSLPGW